MNEKSASKSLSLATTPILGQAPDNSPALAARVRSLGRELGFQQTGIAHTRLEAAERRLFDWLGRGRHGDMDYMHRHGVKRTRPRALIPETVSIVSVRMNYWPQAHEPWAVLGNSTHGYVARYAIGRDYHKLIRRRLKTLAERIAELTGPFAYRAFADSAPVLEKPLAANAGLGWQGKHTNLISRESGSWFFLGELYTSLNLPADAPYTDHCGRCRACIDICPTQAIVAPYQLDARLCIAYLTIEHHGSIPLRLRPAIGNRIFGCDDCQLVCPWNRHAPTTQEPDFAVRHDLDDPDLCELFAWTEADFARRTAGSPLRRLGHLRWLRNIAVALGNAPTSPIVIDALNKRRDHQSEIVREHVHWALTRHLQQR